MAPTPLPHRFNIRGDDGFRGQIQAFAKANRQSLSDAIRQLCLMQLAQQEAVEVDTRSNYRRAEIDEYLFIAIAQLVHERLPGKHDAIMVEAAKNIRQFHADRPGK